MHTELVVNPLPVYQVLSQAICHWDPVYEGRGHLVSILILGLQWLPSLSAIEILCMSRADRGGKHCPSIRLLRSQPPNKKGRMSRLIHNKTRTSSPLGINWQCWAKLIWRRNSIKNQLKYFWLISTAFYANCSGASWRSSLMQLKMSQSDRLAIGGFPTCHLMPSSCHLAPNWIPGHQF